MGHVQHVYVGLAQAQPNNSKWGTLPIRRISKCDTLLGVYFMYAPNNVSHVHSVFSTHLTVDVYLACAVPVEDR